AFLVALYQALLTRAAAGNRSPTSIRALIVAPTRELAVQIHHDALTLGAHTGLRHLVVFGGIDYEKQRLELSQGCEVLIGTPGRLIDYFKQHMYYPSMEEKVPLLIGLLHQSEAVRTMVFVNTKRMAERLESTLKANGFSAQALSGDVPQNKRLRSLRDFHDGKLAVLIATDVASRGLHIPDVSHV